MLSKNPIELGKAFKPTGLRDHGDLLPRKHQRLLGISNAGPLDVFRQVELRHLFELVA